jgi:DNA invertase Pin-like site-specific DNA recombinase
MAQKVCENLSPVSSALEQHLPSFSVAHGATFMRKGDVLVITKLDRLVRSVADLCNILTELERKEVSFRVLNMNLDTTTPTGKLILNLLGSIARSSEN